MLLVSNGTTDGEVEHNTQKHEPICLPHFCVDVRFHAQGRRIDATGVVDNVCTIVDEGLNEAAFRNNVTMPSR